VQKSKGTRGDGKGPVPASTKRTHAERGTDEKGGREFRKGSFTSILQRRSKVRLCPESVDISGHELRLHSDAFRSGSDATAGSPWLLISQPPPSRSRLAGQRRLGSPKGKRSGWPSAAGTALWLSPRCVYEGGFPSTERSCASLWASGGRPPSYSRGSLRPNLRRPQGSAGPTLFGYERRLSTPRNCWVSVTGRTRAIG